MRTAQFWRSSRSPLEKVYVDTECGRLKWGDLRESKERSEQQSPIDPFSETEECGGRKPLLETVISLLQDPKFHDAIVIQGAPGSGKSSFTLRLADHLRREGLRPLRIRLRFLDLKKNISEALAEVIRQPEDGEDPSLSALPYCSDPFLNNSIFAQKTKFGEADICPYVLILDGWDEISVAVNEGFEVEVRRMLDNIRREFLRPRAVKVRIILTGRPSHAVERSLFLRDATPLLTIRDYSSEQLASYLSKVQLAVANNKSPSGAATWPQVDWNSLKVALEKRLRNRSMDILGLPLLTHLSLRLFAQLGDGQEVLLSNPTLLYRSLLDVTCANSGKPLLDSHDLTGQARIRGGELREMLRHTSVALTIYGNESIPFRELYLRLKKSRVKVMSDAEALTKEHPLTNLMISFYFKGGREHLGCEFLHKSFREYLFAEAVVETLKEQARQLVPGNSARRQYWKEFDQEDIRHKLARELSKILSPRALTPEIRSHIRRLLEWEIGRSFKDSELESSTISAQPCSIPHWERARDFLADLWEWWGEGVHLRPQPFQNDSDNLCYSPALINELLDHSLPMDRGPDTSEWWPGRLINADSNLGAGLCQITAWVHAAILRNSGWRPLQYSSLASHGHPRQYQTEYRPDGKRFVLFRPSGDTADYFKNYCTRISATGSGPLSSFPHSLDARFVDLSGAHLMQLDFIDSDFRGAILKGAFFTRSILRGANFTGTDVTGAFFVWSFLPQSRFNGALLEKTRFVQAEVEYASFSNAQLQNVEFQNSSLKKTSFASAIAQGAKFDGAWLHNASFKDTDLTGARFIGADLRGANLQGAILDDVDFSRADLRGTGFEPAHLQGANVSNAQFGELDEKSIAELDLDPRFLQLLSENIDGISHQNED